MANVAILNEQGELIRYLKSVHTPDYEGLPNVVINPTREQLKALPRPAKQQAPAWQDKLTGDRLWKIVRVLRYLKAKGIDLGPDGEGI